MVPGMGHCGGDTAFDKFDLLGGVVDWVETGKAPAAVLSKRTGPEPATRPMCPWPTYAHYTGGDPCKAESFSCRAATG
jgi:feruloyl esterase